MHARVCVCAYVCGGLRGTPCIFLCYLPPYMLGRGLSLTWSLLGALGGLLRSPAVPISSSLERQAQSTMISCFVGARNSNSSSAFRASALPTQSSSQPLRFFKLTFSCFFLLLCFSLLVALGIEPRALYMLSKHSTTELCPQSYNDLSL